MEEYASKIKVRALSKSYKSVKALSDISFDVKAGEMFGLIGPDGAGKTTLFRVLTTLLLPDSGRAEVDGFEVTRNYREIRKRVGYMPGRFSLYQDLSVEENLTFFATLFGTTIAQNYSLIADIYEQLAPFKARKAGNLSGGMKQKLALCCAMIHKPSVLFLDEPTTGVDPVSRKEFWEILKHLKTEGISILVATPYMDEAVLCDRIALIKDGCFLKVDTPENIRESFGEPLWAVSGENPGKLLRYLRGVESVKTCFSFGDTLHLTLKTGTDPHPIEQLLHQSGWGQVRITAIKPGIEDCFMKYTLQ